jgi:hypothetical protein
MDVPALWQSGGFTVVQNLLSTEELAELMAEAAAARPHAARNELATSDGTEGRGGSPARAFASSPAGMIQWKIFGTPERAAQISAICGLQVTATGGGSYAFYERVGDFLAIHRDIEACDLAVITCLADTAASGGLVVYPKYWKTPLSVVRAASKSEAHALSMGPGESAILLGGVLPHEVMPMEPGQERIVSLMCYRTSLDEIPDLRTLDW